MKLFADKNAKPVAFHKPFPIPLHWQEAVKQQLDNDVVVVDDTVGTIRWVPGHVETCPPPRLEVHVHDGVGVVGFLQ